MGTGLSLLVLRPRVVLPKTKLVSSLGVPEQERAEEVVLVTAGTHVAVKGERQSRGTPQKEA